MKLMHNPNYDLPRLFDIIIEESTLGLQQSQHKVLLTSTGHLV